MPPLARIAIGFLGAATAAALISVPTAADADQVQHPVFKDGQAQPAGNRMSVDSSSTNLNLPVVGGLQALSGAIR